MTGAGPESTRAWADQLQTPGGLDASFLRGASAVRDDKHVADRYPSFGTHPGVAVDAFLLAERTPLVCGTSQIVARG